jgi:hypothetical protein
MDITKEAPFLAYKGQEPYIFISYAHNDSAIVFSYISELYSLGYRIWYDEGIDPGLEWPEAIAAAIANCDLMIVFLSPDAVQSVNIRNEINFARYKSKRVLCIYITETMLPDGLALQVGSNQAIMAHKIQDKERFREQMLASLPEKTKEDMGNSNKKQMRTLNIIFEALSQKMSAYFSCVLRTLCEVSVVSVEEQLFKEFNNSLPSPVVLALLSLAPLQGSIILSLSPSAAYGIINPLFGVSGKSDESHRMFTEIEIAVLERILRQFLPMMVEPWEKIAKVDPVLERIETSSQFTQIVSFKEASTIITMQLKTTDADGLIKFCIPHIATRPIARQLATTLM